MGEERTTPLVIRLLAPAAVVVSTVCLAAVLVLGVWMALSDIPIVGAAEPNVVYSLQMYLAGSPLYGDPDRLPFAVTQYSPLYYLIAASVGTALHVSPTDAQNVWRLARLTALAIALATLGLQYLILTRALRLPPGWALVAVAYALLATCPYPFYARPDGILSLTTLACLGCLIASVQASGVVSRWWAAAAGVAAVLAVGSKQSGVTMVVAVAAYTLAARQWRHAAWALTAIAVSAGVVIAGMTWTGSASVVHKNLIEGLDNGLAYYHFLMGVFLPYVRSESILIASCLLFVVAAVHRPRPGLTLLFAIVMAGQFAVATITALKEGSGPNYYDEFAFVASIATCLALHRGGLMGQIGRWAVPAAAAWLLVSMPTRAIDLVYRFGYGQMAPGSLSPVPARQLAGYDELASVIRTQVEPSRGEFVISFDRGLATVVPLHIVAAQTELISQRYSRGISQMDDLRQMLMTGQVKYIIFLKGEVWPDVVGISIPDYFEFVHEYSGQVLYRFRSERRQG